MGRESGSSSVELGVLRLQRGEEVLLGELGGGAGCPLSSALQPGQAFQESLGSGSGAQLCPGMGQLTDVSGASTQSNPGWTFSFA